MCNSLESVLSDLESLDVVVTESPTQQSACVALERGRLIGIRSEKFAISTEKCEALMHEKMHFKYGLFYHPYSPYALKEQTEYRANKHMILEHIPIDELLARIEDNRGALWELAEYFGVTEPFMQKALEFYKKSKAI